MPIALLLLVLIPFSLRAAAFERLEIVYAGDASIGVDLGIMGLFEDFLSLEQDVALEAVTPHEFFFNGNLIRRGPSREAEDPCFATLPTQLIETNDAFMGFVDDPAATERLFAYLQRQYNHTHYLTYLDRRSVIAAEPGEGEMLPAMGSLVEPAVATTPVLQKSIAYSYRLRGAQRRCFVLLGKPHGGFSRMIPTLKYLKGQHDQTIVLNNGFGLPSEKYLAERVLSAYRGLVDYLTPTEDSLYRYSDTIEAYGEDPASGILAANVYKGDALAFKAYASRTIGDKRICVVGLTAPRIKREDFAYEIRDPFGSIEALAKELQDQCDFRIAISNMDAPDNARLMASFPWIDVLVADSSQEYPPYPAEIFSQPNPSHKINAPLRGKLNGSRNIGVISLRSNDGRAFTAQVHKRISLDLMGLYDRTQASLDEASFQDLVVGESDIILPDIQNVWTDQWSITRNDLYNLIASELFTSFNAEVVFLKTTPIDSYYIGPITARQLAKWLPNNDYIVTLFLTGSELKRLAQVLAKRNQRRDTFLALGINDDFLVDGNPLIESNQYKIAMTWVLYQDLVNEELIPAVGILQAFEEQQGPKGPTGQYVESEHASQISLYQFALSALTRKITPVADSSLQREFTFPESLEYLRKAYSKSLDYNRVVYTIDVKSVSLDAANTAIANNAGYDNTRNALVTANNQKVVGGRAEAYMQVDFQDFYLKAGTNTDVSRVKIRNPDGTSVENEQRDNLLLITEAFNKLLTTTWFNTAFTLGPFASFQYDSEVYRNKDSAGTGLLPREHIFRLISGVKLYDGDLIKNFSLGGIVDADYTLPTNENIEYGATSTLELSKIIPVPLTSLVYTLKLDSKYFLPSSKDTSDDLGIEFSASNRVLIPFFKAISLEPFVDIFYFRGKLASNDHFGHNVSAGVALTYAKTFKPQFEHLF